MSDLQDSHAIEIVRVDLTDDRRVDGVDDILLIDDVITERRDRYRAAALDFLGHAALDLAGQIDAIEFVEPLDDALDQRAEGTVDDGLGDRFDLDVILRQHALVKDALLLVAGEAAEFPQQHRREGGGLLFSDRDHANERGALLGFSSGNTVVAEDVLVRHDVAVLLCVFADLLDLRIGGELRLIVGADANVRRGGFQLNIHTLPLDNIGFIPYNKYRIKQIRR